MAVSSIPPKAMQNLRAFIKLNISSEQLEKGYTLFRQPGSVEWVFADDETMIAACWEGDHSFRVELDPSAADEPVFCSCGDRCCRHDLAVLLDVLRVAGKMPEMFVMECHAAAKNQLRQETHKELAAADEPPAAPSAPTGQKQTAEAEPLSWEPLSPEPLAAVVSLAEARMDKTRGKRGKLTFSQPVFPEPEESAAQWRAYFRDRFHKALMHSRPGNYMFGLGSELKGFYYHVVEEMADESKGWPPTVRGLFVLHAQLYAMEALEQFFAQPSFNPSQIYGFSQITKELASAASQHIEEILAVINMEEVQTRYNEAMKEALELLRLNTFTPTPPHLDWSALYQTLWGRIFLFSGEWGAEERTRLEELQSQTSNDSLLTRVRTSLALFDFLDGKDEAALAILTAHSSLPRDRYMYYVNHLYDHQAWSRLLVWLRGLTRFLRRESYLLNHEIFPMWLNAAESQPEEPGWIEWIKLLLPQSQDIYTIYLIENGDARQVAHMLLSQGHPIYYIDRDILRLLEKTDLRLVLPLYHQDAERYILEKNRQSYKQAVRLLKKLAGFYKKLKEQDRWQLYIGQLAERHSRLRAFQEELRRGKLIQ
ncbi:hypothetical protein [Paenibacillus mesotrionivorans]|uniref:hypothetical protein n=1 Tax=Paenibacillus mesotrionivorans TaxID=3160968 RepID=UPI003A10292D